METYFQSCHLCPRQCGVNRLAGQVGFCGETADLRVASIEAHFGEEPPISGTCGSGTVFFSGCSLQCDFCQNYQLAHHHLGKRLRVSDVVQRLVELVEGRGIHNVNFVTPDHFFPHTWEIVGELRRRNLQIPIVYNVSGYEQVDVLKTTEPVASIYLPDFKYADRRLGEQLSHCQNYPAVALDALTEMIRQKGFLDSFQNDAPETLARQGVLVRHLILPGQVQNSLDALSTLFLEFGKNLPLSLMSQYHPVQRCALPDWARRITPAEFEQVYDHALSLGFCHLFVQYPETVDGKPEFLPDFTQDTPFDGNKRL